MDEKLNIESTSIELNSNVKDAVSKEELKNEKDTVTLLSLMLEKIEPVNHTVVLQESTIDGNDSQKHHAIRSSIANLTETIHERVHAINTTENVAKLIKFYTMVTLVVVICTMIVLFSVPVILYFTKPPTMELNKIINGVDFESCSANISVPTIDHLLQLCIMDLPPNCDYSAIINLYSVYNLSSLVNASQCNNDTLSFFCDAALLLCDDNSSPVNLIEECKEVRDNKCASEWRIVENFFNKSIPDCTSFTKDGVLTFTSAPKLNCSNQFDHFCGSTCAPVCGDYSLLTEDTSTYYIRFVVATCGIIGLIGGVVTLTACYYNRQKVLHFPQVYIVYTTIAYEIGALLQALPFYMDRSVLMCSDRNFLVSIGEPTTFCQIQGFTMQLVIAWFTGFWVFHVFHLFLSLMYPFRVKEMMDSNMFRRKVHLTEVMIVVSFGFVVPVLTISISQYQDNGLYCSPQSQEVLFYAGLIPGLLIYITGLTLLFGSFWILRRKHRLLPGNIAVSKILCLRFSVGEFKLTLLFCYYGIGLFFYLGTLVAILIKADDLIHYSYQYMACSAGGDNDYCEQYRKKSAELVTTPTVFGVIHIMLSSLTNFSHLLYVIPFSTVKRFFQKLYK